jgi:hypothetical protein
MPLTLLSIIILYREKTILQNSIDKYVEGSKYIMDSLNNGYIVSKRLFEKIEKVETPYVPAFIEKDEKFRMAKFLR